MIVFVLFAMIFCHIVDDYYLQGILAKMKQASWWRENTTLRMYRNDYIPALVCHAFSWSFMVMLPIAIYAYFTNAQPTFWFIFYPAFTIWNMWMHAMVDDAKANKKELNLIEDQIIHLSQIIVTFVAYILIG